MNPRIETKMAVIPSDETGDELLSEHTAQGWRVVCASPYSWGAAVQSLVPGLPPTGNIATAYMCFFTKDIP